MGASYSVDDSPDAADAPLRQGAAPHAIRSALLAADRDAFDRSYEAALADARASQDFTVLFRSLEHWRGIAVLHRDRQAFAALARRVAERVTGEPSPADEPLEVTRAKAGL